MCALESDQNAGLSIKEASSDFHSSHDMGLRDLYFREL